MEPFVARIDGKSNPYRYQKLKVEILTSIPGEGNRVKYVEDNTDPGGYAVSIEQEYPMPGSIVIIHTLSNGTRVFRA